VHWLTGVVAGWVAAVVAASQNDHDACASMSEESPCIGTKERDVEVVAWSFIEEHCLAGSSETSTMRPTDSRRRSHLRG
jgi:hypothetical protein